MLARHELATVGPERLTAELLTEAVCQGAADAAVAAFAGVPESRRARLLQELGDDPVGRLLLPSEVPPQHAQPSDFVSVPGHVVLIQSEERAGGLGDELAKDLVELGMTVTVVCLGSRKLGSSARGALKCVSLTQLPDPGVVAPDPSIVAALKTEMARASADIILVEPNASIAWAAMIAAQDCGRPFVLMPGAPSSEREAGVLRMIATKAAHTFQTRRSGILQSVSPSDRSSWLPDWMPVGPSSSVAVARDRLPHIGLFGSGPDLGTVLVALWRLRRDGLQFRLRPDHSTCGNESLFRHFGLEDWLDTGGAGPLHLAILLQNDDEILTHLAATEAAILAPQGAAGDLGVAEAAFLWPDGDHDRATEALRRGLTDAEAGTEIARRARDHFRHHRRRVDVVDAVRTELLRLSAAAALRPAKQGQVWDRDVLQTIGWPEPTYRSPVTAMVVVDGFTQDCVSPDMNLIQPRPDNWRGLLDRDQPDLLLVESAWQGNGGSWQYRVARYRQPPGRELSAMINEVRSRNVPSVFWNKEDPVHFENFRDAALLFDHVFTTAFEAVPQYQALGCRSVHVMPFAAQPRLHNPIGSAQRNGRTCFAGSYYANRFEARRLEQVALLEAASSFHLDIYDRNAGAIGDFQFPPHLRSHVRGRLTYKETNEAYRHYSVFLNVNSVTDSRTMFSRRVFELLACGTPVVSTPSPGITELLGDDTVFIVKSRGEAEEAIALLHERPEVWRERSLRGIRRIFRGHCYHHRIDAMLETVGLDRRVTAEIRCAILAYGSGPAAFDSLNAEASRQVLPGTQDDVLLEPLHLGSRSSMSDCDELLSRLARQRITHVAVLHEGIRYEPHCIEDMIHAATYSKARVITKASDAASRYSWAEAVDPRACLLSVGDLRRAVRFQGPGWLNSPQELARLLRGAFPDKIFACGGDSFLARTPLTEDL